MKTRLIFLVLLIVCFSCATNNKPVSDAQKEKIKAEVKEVLNTVIKDQEAVNPDMILGSCLDSPDFVFTYSGNTYGYKQFVDMAKSVFGTLKSQKITITDEKYAVLDNSTVMVTLINKCMINYKDGHSILQDPWISQFTFKKTDNKWKIISETESGVEKNVPGESSKDLNQVEIVKQWVGSWTGKIDKDTTLNWNIKSCGTGLECYYKYFSKGKLAIEGEQFWGYDKSSDKYIVAHMVKGIDIGIYVCWFTSKTKYVFVPFNDMSNPEKAYIKYEGEFKSPNIYAETKIVNNKPVNTYSFTRVK
jgi:hypothetical protein